MKLNALDGYKKPYRLLTPGPVPLPPFVLEALGRPMLHHRTPEFDRVLQKVLSQLPLLFGTKEPVMMLTATGSGAMEAALTNTLSPGDEILCIDSGKFGERWAEMAKAFHLNVSVMKVPWGEAVDPLLIEQHLAAHPQTRAVLTQVCETSTATLHPIEKISLLTRSRPNTLLIVDAITALGATPLPMDDWGLDVVITGSQKAMMLPAGLSFISLSAKAWHRSENAKIHRYYFDLKRERSANEKGQTYFSSAVSHIVALEKVLDFFAKIGLSQMQQRCAALAQGTRRAAATLGINVFSSSPSPSVTALVVPEGVDGAKLRLEIEKSHNITVMGGQDQLAGKILRVGHLGAITDEDMIAFFKALSQSINSLSDHQISSNQLDLAIHELSTTLNKGPRIDYGFSH